MKILIVSLNFSPELTATGKYTGEMAKWLSSENNEVHVIAAPPHYPKWEVDENYRKKSFTSRYESKVKVMRVPCYIPTADKLNAKTRILMETSFTLLSLFWWLPILFRKQKYDIVISICPPMQTALFPFLYKIFRKVPYVFHIQDFQVDMALELGILKKNPITSLLYKIEQYLLLKATRVTTITEAMLNRARAKGVEHQNLALCPNWSNIDSIAPSTHNNSFRFENGYNQKDFLVLYSGGMGIKQGLDIIIDAAEKLKNKEYIKFLIVGNGGAKPHLVATTKAKKLKNVKFLDIQPFDVLPKMLTAANVHLVIQKSQATDLVMPSKLTNILASGRPAIATAFPQSALGLVIEKYNTGLLISPENADLLQQAILDLSKSAEDQIIKGQNARAYAERYLDINNIMHDFNTVMENAFADNRKKP